MRYFIFILAILILLAAFFVADTMRGEASEMFTDATEITVTANEQELGVSYSWDTEVTASVPVNSCNLCLKYAKHTRACLLPCKHLVITEY
jgi:hypothetical protein